MKTIRVLLALLALGSCLAFPWAYAQKDGIGRAELTRRDFGDGVHEVIQTRVDFAPGAAFPRHAHPGVEVAYVLSGSIQYQFDGKPPFELKAGDSLFIPAGTVHSARNTGAGNASELATYAVVKGKPLVATAP